MEKQQIKTEAIHCVTTPDNKKRMLDYAKAHGITLSDLVRCAVDKFMEETNE